MEDIQTAQDDLPGEIVDLSDKANVVIVAEETHLSDGSFSDFGIATDAAEEVDINEEVEDDSVEGEEPIADLVADPAAPAVLRQRAAVCPLDIPMAVTRRLMKSAAGTKRFTPDLIAACSRSAGAFALYLLSASQEAAAASKRTTLRPIEVIEGLLACGFPELAEEVRVSLNVVMTKKKKKVHRK